jgi:chemotaxis protein MotB
MGGGGGAWKVAYADFVTAMMAFFLVMWIVAQGKPVKEAIAGYFRNPGGISTLPGQGSSLMPSKKNGTPFLIPKIAPKDFKGLGSSKKDNGVDLESDEKEGEMVKAQFKGLSGNNFSAAGVVVAFTEDSRELDEESMKILDKLAPELAGKRMKIELRGHALGRSGLRGHPAVDPWELSYARSMATMRYLIVQGIAPDRFRLSQSGPFEPGNMSPKPGQKPVTSFVEVYMLNEIVANPAQAIERPGKSAPAVERHGNEHADDSHH